MSFLHTLAETSPPAEELSAWPVDQQDNQHQNEANIENAVAVNEEEYKAPLNCQPDVRLTP